MLALSDKQILILAGPPGVGKTTVAEILAERSGRAVHLESDAFFRFIRSGYVEPWKPESHQQNQTVMQAVAEAASTYAEAGYFTIIDGIIVPGWFLDPLRDTFRRAGHDVAYAVLRASLPLCTARARGREHEPLDNPAAVERLWQNFADLGDLEQHALEVGDDKPEDIADSLARLLEKGLLAV